MKTFKKILLVLILLFVVLVIIDNSKTKEKTEVVSPTTVSRVFSGEQAVTIVGYDDHAMEPSISRDGKYLFWNSLNDAKDTSLYYAKRVDDTTFNFVGKVEGANGTRPHLDAVPSLDLNNELYWVSLRDYPKVVENYQHARFVDARVTNVFPVQGDFYIREPGWIIMDAEISPDGQTLLYVVADFSKGGTIPSDSIIGIARKNGERFVKDKNSDILFQNINSKDFIGYAPAYSTDGLTLLFTRLEKNATRIYVSTRSSTNAPFRTPVLVDIAGKLPEAPSLSVDGKNLYYHKKVGSTYKIFMMKKVVE